MNKKIILILITLTTTQLFCSETTLHSGLAKVTQEETLAAATRPVERFSYTIEPSNQITEEEADKHKNLADAAFNTTSWRREFPYTFLYELNKKRDVVVSAYETEEDTQQQILVGGLFGTKYRCKGPSSEPPGFVTVETQINSLYVAERVQRQGIGTQMVKLFKEYTRSLPIALYVKTTNMRGKAFWDSQREFEKSINWLGYSLLQDDEPDTSLKRKDVITYYSENNSGKTLYVDSSDEELP